MPKARTIIENLWPEKKIFIRLRDLLNFISINNHEDRIVLSIEKKNHGREFCQLTMSELELLYVLIPKNDRSFYECICENQIIKTYVDFEYCTEKNSEVDHNRAISTCLKILFFVLKLSCKSDINLDMNLSSILKEFLVLDASTAKKRSCHFIHANPSVLFENTKTLGVYIKSILQVLLTGVAQHTCSSFNLPNDLTSTSTRSILALLSPHVNTIRAHCSDCFLLNGVVSAADVAHLIVYNKDNESILSIDLNVYNKNQQFRLYDSTKQGQDNSLITTSHYPFDQTKTHSYFDIVRKSLITDITDHDLPLITLVNDQLFIKLNSSKLMYKIANIDTYFGRHNQKKLETIDSTESKSIFFENKTNENSSRTSIPRTDSLDSTIFHRYIPFISEIITQDSNHKGRIHSHVRGTRNTNKLFFNITDNYRFCPKIKRHHQRNSIAIIVDVSNNTFAIRCKDVQCDNTFLQWHRIDK